MPAYSPAEIHTLFQHAFNLGDVETLIALYETEVAPDPSSAAWSDDPGNARRRRIATRSGCAARWLGDRASDENGRRTRHSGAQH